MDALSGNNDFSVELLKATLNRLRQKIAKYNDDLFIYDTERVAYNKQINDIKRFIATNKPPQINYDGSSSILSRILGEVDEQIKRVYTLLDYELPEFPEPPVPPKKPIYYTGPMLDELTPVLGYGKFSHGEMRMRVDFGTKKFFGVSGQG